MRSLVSVVGFYIINPR